MGAWQFAGRMELPCSTRRLATVLVLCLTIFVVGGCGSTEDIYGALTTDVLPRLQNNEAERRGAVINDAAFNGAAEGRTIAPYTGYVGDLRVIYDGDRSAIRRDLTELGQVAPPDFNPNEMVTIDFKGSSINFILEQLLRGALGINYVAPDNLPGGITFRTETQVPKSRIIQIVRDLLARNDLVMRFINGVFHIGAPEVIETLETNATLGRGGEEIARVVKLDRGNASQVSALASQMLPQNVSVLVTSSPNTLLIRANPNDIDSIERMLRVLSQTAVGFDQVAIIPLQRSAPEAVATQLTEFYAPSLRENEERVTIVPLRNQQAILVGTSDATLMHGLTQLARQLDRSVTDVSELRVIPLTHLRADDIVPQLTQIFGSTVAQGAQELARGPEEARATTGVLSRLRPPRPAPVEDNADGSALSVPGPSGGFGASAQSGEEGGQGRGDRLAGAGQAGGFDASSAMAAPEAGETRIVADQRTNTILVYSTYSVYKRMREVVETLDVAQAQVVIEATVVEVQLTDELQSGVQFFLRYKGIVAGSGIPAGNQEPAPGGMIGIGTDLGSVSVDAVLRALRSVTNLKVVSSPYLTVLDGQSARLVIGDQIPFAATSQTSNNQGSVTVTQQIEILDTGIVLQITPRIHANNSVSLDIVQSVSQPVTGTEEGDLTPTISTRDISSQILAQSGRTILLGGLIQERMDLREDGVPVASQLPVVGALFRQNSTDQIRTELLVLITPRVVRASSEIEAITRMLQGVRSPQDLKAAN